MTHSPTHKQCVSIAGDVGELAPPQKKKEGVGELVPPGGILWGFYVDVLEFVAFGIFE